jgi:RNA polymerase sigma factor (sigma-70 family)
VVTLNADRTALVTTARAGSTEAYGSLVEAYQDYAVACAVGYGVDWHAAHDVAQEAFLSLPSRLPELRDPQAFPLWFRRIVRTVALRHLRGMTPLELTDAVPDQPADEDGAPVSARSVDRALGSLSDGQRLVVALQYFGGVAQADIAAFLGLPLSTVKKRAHDGRRRLKEVLPMVESIVRAAAPSRSPGFRQTVELFAAIRRDDVAHVQRLVRQSPHLVEARESWSVDDALAVGLGPSGSATPLVRAAVTGSTRMIDALLDLGADVNGVCACDTRESALWAAVEVNSVDCVRLLLARGADPDLPAALGVTPLILAAMRGATDVTDELLASGADPSRTDTHGRTAADWQRGDADNDSGRTPDDLHTGIKGIDLLVPLRKGDLVAVASSYGLGLRVLLAELSLRLPGPATWVVATSSQNPAGAIEAAVRELGAGTAVAVVTMPVDVDVERQIAAVEHAVRTTTPALLVLIHGEVRTTAFDAVLASLRQREGLDLVLVVEPTQPVPTPRSGPTMPEGFDAFLALDPRRARANLWPAIDVVRSSRREDVAGPLRELLSSYDVVDPELRLDPPGPLDATVAARAQALHRYLTQPFRTAEPHTATPSVWVSSDQLRLETEQLLHLA